MSELKDRSVKNEEEKKKFIRVDEALSNLEEAIFNLEDFVVDIKGLESIVREDCEKDQEAIICCVVDVLDKGPKIINKLTNKLNELRRKLEESLI